MRPIEPQRDRWQEIAHSKPPPWRLAGGMMNGGLTYEHHDGSRAHYHSEDGDLVLVTWDPAGETTLPDREQLEAVVDRDLRAFQESARPEVQVMLMLSGIGRYSAMRNHRGRRRRWTGHRLSVFAREFVEHGERWSPEHERWAQERWNLQRRQALDVMRRAEAVGIVAIEKSAGPRSANLFRLTGAEQATPDARASADWHRRQWLELERKRRELERAWRSSPNQC